MYFKQPSQYILERIFTVLENSLEGLVVQLFYTEGRMVSETFSQYYYPPGGVTNDV